MTETYLTFKLTHKRPLPGETAEVVALRIYGWLISRGVESGVEPVIQPEMQALVVKEMRGEGDGIVSPRVGRGTAGQALQAIVEWAANGVPTSPHEAQGK